MIRLSTIQRAPFLLMAAVLWCAGCGGAPASKKPVRAPTETRSDSTAHNEVARNTRRATLDRKGSWSLTSDKVEEVAPIVTKNAAAYGLPEDLIFGIIWVESRFDPRAKSPVGARGLMQLMPRTASYLAECIDWRGRSNAYDPEFNISAGTYYIARLIREFDGDEDLALAAYNAGPAKVRRWMKEDGLPKVSIEYASMVQTARTFFGRNRSATVAPPAPIPDRTPAASPTPAPIPAPSPAPEITDDDLDRLGLTILIAGLSDRQFGLEREDDPAPFD